MTLPLASVNPYGASFAMPILIDPLSRAFARVFPLLVLVHPAASSRPPRAKPPAVPESRSTSRRVGALLVTITTPSAGCPTAHRGPDPMPCGRDLNRMT